MKYNDFIIGYIIQMEIDLDGNWTKYIIPIKYRKLIRFFKQFIALNTAIRKISDKNWLK